MNYLMIIYILSWVLTFEGIFMIPPVVVAAVYQEQQGITYLLIAVLCIILGVLGRLKSPKNKSFVQREGLVAVSLSWMILSLVGAVPFYLTGDIPSYIDALFETISGFTTTGSTILSDVETLSHCSLFWRSFTHWIGGMGVIVFIMAVLPLSGSSGMHMMKTESPGPSVGKLVPRVKRTAMILYAIYCGITLLEMLLLILSGMSVFESLTLTFGTVGTGGFGVLNSSIASYSIASQIIITIFMIVSSINFNFYFYLLIRKPKNAFAIDEVKYYLLIILASAFVITVNIKDGFSSIWEAFHTSIFQVASVISTTGYTTADFNNWPELSRTILVILMFVGACAGSTGGGFKVSRLLIVLKAVKNEILAIAHPRSVNKVHLNGRQVPEDMVRRAFSYLAAYVLIVLASVLVLSFDNKETTTNVTAVMATFNNIGPGLNMVGPIGNFGSYSILSKFMLMFDMLVGRLEIFPILILFSAGIWKLPTWKTGSRKKN